MNESSHNQKRVLSKGRRLIVASAIFCLFLSPVHTSEIEQLMPSIGDVTASMTSTEGFFNLHWDESTGKLYWEIDKFDTGFIYMVSMASGLGSNPVGIDRAQLGGRHIFEAHRVGPRVLLTEANYRYIARTDNPAEAQAVKDAFASSVHWGFDIVAETDGSVLVDGTDFFLRDAGRVIERLARRGQGHYRLDVDRSAIHLPRTRSFPENTEVEALLTFTTSEPGRLVREVAANGHAVSLRQHHSFIGLPDDNYQPRVFDPRVGINGPTLYDYATPIDESLQIRWVARHRLEKKNPSAERSEPVKPIVYYVDPGIPEPVRSAVIEGASWWNEAFEAAGYIDAFRVEILPPDKDPQDIRHNMIHWIHRRTRGYSYGSSVIDPRTGEIIKGNVSLGSLRLRQDYLHGQGVNPPFTHNQATYYEPCGLSDAPSFEYLAQISDKSDAVEMALARVRQLSAHEVGHTLGFPHNYMASSYGRESVMDYPAPLVEILEDDTIDLSNAYLRRIGTYDEMAITWLYQDFPEGVDETKALRTIAEDGIEKGLIYMGHTNNNFVGASHQYASVWDNGANLVDHLKHEIEVRRIGLSQFGPNVIRQGTPLASLEHVLLPLYLHHRFQLNAAAQSLGGADYRYALRGDKQTPFTIVPGDEQRKALETILVTLTVDFLALPERIIRMIPPPASRFNAGETFEGHTALIFDPLGAAEGAASLSAQRLLHPERMARLVVFGSLGDYPDLTEVIDRLIDVTWNTNPPDNEYHGKVLNVIQRVVVDEMMRQASQSTNAAEVRAVLSDRLHRLAKNLAGKETLSPHQRLVVTDIQRWENRTEDTVPNSTLELPAGDPIGGSSRQ